MAPEPEILKRERKRPSDYWVLSAPNTTQQDEPPVKKRAIPLNTTAKAKGIKDAPQAGNRGKSVKGKEVVRGEANDEEDELQDKSVRTGKSPGGREELEREGVMLKAAKKDRKGNITRPVTEGQPATTKRGVSLAAQAGEQAKEAAADETATRKKGGGNAHAEVAEPSKQSKSLKRRRPSNTEEGVSAAVESASQAQGVTKKRGRPPAAEKESENGVDEVDGGPIAPPKRARPRRPEAEQPAKSLADENTSKEKRKKRLSDAERLQAEIEFMSRTEAYAKGPRRLPIAERMIEVPGGSEYERSRKRPKQTSYPERQPSVDHEERGRPRTRPSDATLEESDMAGRSKQAHRSLQKEQRAAREAKSSKLSSKRSGSKKGVKPAANKRTKPAKASASAEESQPSRKRTRSSIEGGRDQSQPSQAHRKGSKRQSQVEPKSRKRKSVEKPPETQPSKRRRIEKNPTEEQESPEDGEVPMYQHLQSVTHRVSRQTIEVKWEPLPATCIERISQLLHDLQRPIVVRYNDERKKIQSSTALQMISRRLVSKISKGLPFPQGTRNHRQDDFDFEKILDHNRALEAQLTPVIHANELLETHISKEMALLEAEKDALATLEANAKTEAVLRKEAGRKSHSVLQLQGEVEDVADLKDDLGLSVIAVSQSLDLSIQNDEQLQALAIELHGHVDSIQGNIRQVEGVMHAISKSRAAVQATLFHNLNREQYGKVVLGTE